MNFEYDRKEYLGYLKYSVRKAFVLLRKISSRLKVTMDIKIIQNTEPAAYSTSSPPAVAGMLSELKLLPGPEFQLSAGLGHTTALQITLQKFKQYPYTAKKQKQKTPHPVLGGF